MATILTEMGHFNLDRHVRFPVSDLDHQVDQADAAWACSDVGTLDLESLAQMTDRLWNPSMAPNVVGESRTELVDDFTRYALTF